MVIEVNVVDDDDDDDEDEVPEDGTAPAVEDPVEVSCAFPKCKCSGRNVMSRVM